MFEQIQRQGNAAGFQLFGKFWNDSGGEESSFHLSIAGESLFLK